MALSNIHETDDTTQLCETQITNNRIAFEEAVKLGLSTNKSRAIAPGKEETPMPTNPPNVNYGVVYSSLDESV